MGSLTRRDFLKTSMAVGTGIGLAAALPVGSRVLGANDTVQMAVVGFRSKGAQHIQIINDLPGARVAALCDVDSDVMAREVQRFKNRNEPVLQYTDVRELLENQEVDAVVTATPNHWHALVTVWACQAGKDVYVEKPVAHDIWQGHKMVEAARKYNRIVQAGTQLRSDEGLAAAFEYIRAGNIGKITLARTLHYGRRESIGKVFGPQPIPSSVDYDLWTGPAPMKPLMRKRLHYDWHWFWDTGNGELGNNGVHRLDLCRWVLGENNLPERILSIGGRFGFNDNGQTPNTHLIYYDYARTPIICEIRGLPQKKDSPVMDVYRDIRIGIVIHGEDGYFAGSGGGGWIYDNDGNKVKSFEGDAGAGHHQNFLKAIRSRNPEDLNAEIYNGHISSSLCHLGNISHLCGEVAPPEAARESIDGDPDMVEAYDRFREHLQANEVNLAETKLTLGAWLQYDTATRHFSHPDPNTETLANGLLRQEYREPFAIHDSV